MIHEIFKIEGEPIYAADSLNGYHFRVNTHRLFIIGNVILIWVYTPHLINYNKPLLYFTLKKSKKPKIKSKMDMSNKSKSKSKSKEPKTKEHMTKGSKTKESKTILKTGYNTEGF
ncbi:hypothetical protein DSO57_1035253 [Entomophthora muscae]|uniref:Uncharacterized protein n=1 Tax=Entomophthora muscae TaxID=34485 RepID=A0ACC2TLU8_9FUNG|nr:hypothetical protein DSO57_1035253 [Entomophthora muscae]